MATKDEKERAAVDSGIKRIINTKRELAGKEVSHREASNQMQRIAERERARQRDGGK